MNGTLRERLRSMYAARQRDISTDDGRQVYSIRATDDRLRDLIVASEQILFLMRSLELVEASESLDEAKSIASDAIISMGDSI